MDIRKLLSEPVADRTVEVPYQGSTYLVRGRPDAGLIGRTVYLPDEHAKLRAEHYRRVLGDGASFDPDDVRRILLVAATLVPPEGEAPYDETEIARLATQHGVLFLALAGAALTVVGLVQEDEDAAGPTLEVAASNPFGGDPDGSS